MCVLLESRGIFMYVSVFLWIPVSSCYRGQHSFRHKRVTDAILALKKVGTNFFIRFSDNQMKLNTGKCHLLSTT